jgi:hypothetical protein
MRVPLRAAFTLAAVTGGVAGCADDGPVASAYRCVAAGGEGCFEPPSAAIAAATGDGSVVPAALDCAPYELVTSQAPVELAGTTVELVDRQAAAPLVRVEAYRDLAQTTPVLDTASDAAGQWSATVSALPSVAFVRTTAPSQLPLVYPYVRFEVSGPSAMIELHAATRAQIAQVFERVGDRFLPGRSQLLATAYDCAGNRLVHAIANLASATGVHGSRLFVPDVRVYYGSEGSDSPAPALARRSQLAETSTSGSIGMSNLPPGRHYVQLWAFESENDILCCATALRLLAEYPLEVHADEVGFMMTLHARR